MSQLLQPDLDDLLHRAELALKTSYSPYSKTRVGAALAAADGSIYLGCNMEVVNMSGSICAERNALTTAVSDGRRHFVAVAVMSDTIDECWPCGVCREVLAEFGNLTVAVKSSAGDILSAELSALIPHHFKL